MLFFLVQSELQNFLTAQLEMSIRLAPPTSTSAYVCVSEMNVGVFWLLLKSRLDLTLKDEWRRRRGQEVHLKVSKL